MKNIKKFKEYTFMNEDYGTDSYETDEYPTVETDEPINQEDSIDQTASGDPMEHIIESAVKSLKILIKFGSIMNEEQLHSKASELLNLMYKMNSTDEEKQILSSSREEILNRIIDRINSEEDTAFNDSEY